MVKASFAVPLILCVCASTASAQHFGSDWIDRVTHRLDVDRGPLEEAPVDVQAWAGVAYYFDDNIYHEDGDEDDSSIVVPFGRARLTYQELKLEAEVDIMANQNFYVDETNETGDEQRAYARIRQADSKYNVEITQLFQHVSSPLNVQFADRADRFISDTMIKASVDVGEMWAVEADGRFGVVRYEDSQLTAPLDNRNGEAYAGLVWRGPYGYDLIAQAGYFGVQYLNDQKDGAPPEAWGYVARGGFRGELVPSFWVEALAGYTEVESDYFFATTVDVDGSTGYARIRTKYEMTETLNVWASYYRHYTFAGNVDPYQLINRFVLMADAELSPQFTARAKFQYDFADTASGIERTYYTVGGSLTYQVTTFLILDGGAHFIGGETEGAVVAPPSSVEYDNFIVHFGVVLTH